MSVFFSQPLVEFTILMVEFIPFPLFFKAIKNAPIKSARKTKLSMLLHIAYTKGREYIFTDSIPL